MTILIKVLLTCFGITLQTICALLVIGANEISASQFPILHFVILIQVPLLTVVWARQARASWRLLAYIIGLAASVVALYVVSPHLQGFAMSAFSNAAKLDVYGFFGAGLLGLLLFLGCLLVCGFMVPRAILSFGRR